MDGKEIAWIEIKTQSDADAMMARFGDFHDGCIREVFIWTGYWVSPDLAMQVPPELDTRVRLHIQRQWKDPRAIEMLFEEVIRFNLAPAPENYESIIFSAKILVLDELIHWAPSGNWNPNCPDINQDTWISARKLKWREVDDWIGEALHYGPIDDA